MDKKYHIGRMQITDNLKISEIKKVLVNKGILNFAIPSERIPQKLEEALQNFKAENIKNNVVIGETIGKHATQIVIFDDEALYINTATESDGVYHVDGDVVDETLILGGN